MQPVNYAFSGVSPSRWLGPVLSVGQPKDLETYQRKTPAQIVVPRYSWLAFGELVRGMLDGWVRWTNGNSPHRDKTAVLMDTIKPSTDRMAKFGRLTVEQSGRTELLIAIPPVAAIAENTTRRNPAVAAYLGRRITDTSGDTILNRRHFHAPRYRNCSHCWCGNGLSPPGWTEGGTKTLKVRWSRLTTGCVPVTGSGDDQRSLNQFRTQPDARLQQIGLEP